MKVLSFRACLDEESCGDLLIRLSRRHRPGWELKLCEWDPKQTGRSTIQYAANTMLKLAKGMTHAGFAFFSPLQEGELILGKESALLTFNTLSMPNAGPDHMPADLQSLFAGVPVEKDVLRKQLAPELALNRAACFRFPNGFADAALGAVSQAAASENGYAIPSTEIAKQIGAYATEKEAAQYALVCKASFRAAVCERDRMFLDWLVRAWHLNRVEPKEVAAGLAALETPFRLSSAFPELAVQKLGLEKGNWLAEAMAPITAQEAAPKQINPQQIV